MLNSCPLEVKKTNKNLFLWVPRRCTRTSSSLSDENLYLHPTQTGSSVVTVSWLTGSMRADEHNPHFIKALKWFANFRDLSGGTQIWIMDLTLTTKKKTKHLQK